MGEADQVGTFSNSAAMLIKNKGEQVLVADYDTNSITVFGINEYGKQVKHLDTLTLDGDYDGIKEGWHDVIEQDANVRLLTVVLLMLTSKKKTMIRHFTMQNWVMTKTHTQLHLNMFVRIS